MSDVHKFSFELVSPEEKLVSENLYMAEVPGDEGEFGVMAGHASLVSSLRAGVVSLHKDQGPAERKIFIAGGFADVTPQGCTILAEEAINVSDLNKEMLEQELKDLAEDLEMAEEPLDKKRVEAKIAMAKAKLAAVS